jgi:hypothetical protein
MENQKRPKELPELLAWWGMQKDGRFNKSHYMKVADAKARELREEEQQPRNQA